MRKSIYLDSNDFSDLSKPEDQLNNVDAEVLSAIRAAVANGSAVVLLSPPLLSEAVHANAASKEYALRRAQLIRELCDKNFLRYPTDVCKLEFDRLLSEHAQPIVGLNDILSGKDEWFGKALDLKSLHETRKDAQRAINERLAALPPGQFTRAQRRKMKSQISLFKASSRPLLRELMASGQVKSNQEFPLNLIDQKQYVDWLLGENPNFDLPAQLRGLMSDPYILFEHIVDGTGHRENLYNIVRSGGERLAANLNTLAEQIIEAGDLAAQAGQSINARDIGKQIVNPSLLRTVLEPLSERQFANLSDAAFLELVEQCPSASTLAHVLREYFSTIFQSNFERGQLGKKAFKPTKKSDFGDLMHILYAPYVDIFRCDARFGEHLKSGKFVRTRVAPRRADILRML